MSSYLRKRGQICLWLAAASSDAASARYLARIEAFIIGMSEASERGTRHDDVRPGMRIVGFERRVTIAFVVQPNHVLILRVLYGGRDWSTLLTPG